MPRHKSKPGRKPLPVGHRLTVGDAEIRAIFAASVAVLIAPPDILRRLGIESFERSALRVLVARIEETPDFEPMLR